MSEDDALERTQCYETSLNRNADIADGSLSFQLGPIKMSKAPSVNSYYFCAAFTVRIRWPEAVSDDVAEKPRRDLTSTRAAA